MLIPIRTDSPLRKTPYMNWLLIAANVVVFLFEQQGGPGGPSIKDAWALRPRDPHLFNFISYAFVHEGLWHLAGNMLFLYIFGNNVNDKLGHLGYLALYLAGGVFAGVCYVTWQGGNEPVIGASGAVSAITGAYLILLPRSNITVFYFFLFIGQFELPSMWFILAFFALDIVQSTSGDQVAHVAHIGGTVFGAVICLGLLAVTLLPRDPFDCLALIQRWNKRRQYRDVVASGYNPFGYSPPRVSARVLDPVQEKAMELRAGIGEAIGRRDSEGAKNLFLQLKAVDPRQVLARQAQLDMANQLAHDQLFADAADAYEMFLRHYANYEQVEQVELMLGLVYARYLNRPDLVREHLNKALPRLHDPRAIELAQAELNRLAPPAL